MEWSLDLLGAEERRLFARLAVFAGSGTTDAAATVCGSEPLATDQVPAMIHRLVRASLLVAHPDVPGRWSMLESIRELAAIELEAAGDAADMAARHRQWYARWVEAVEDAWDGPGGRR